MFRRDFLRRLSAASVAAVIPHSAISHSAWATTPADHHGDLRLRPLASDHFEMLFAPKRSRPLRLLQIADTHFHPGDDTNRATEQLLRSLVANQSPDFIVHTGDFVNNDNSTPVDWTGLDVLNGLGLPWTLCFGNHDYPVQRAEGSRALDEIRQGMQRGYQGYVDRETGRHYCYRYDVQTAENAAPAACLFFFQVGYQKGDRRISDPQLAWFSEQIERDAQREVNAPITVFVHIPLVEYHQLYESGSAIGTKGENVCFDSDTGESFKRFAASGRVVGVFCGHDHVNDYHGQWQGIDLVYGRVSGWGGYGPDSWKRGARLITLDLENPRPLPRHEAVF